MKFLNLQIMYEASKREINFTQKTLIYSDDNSVGKSTLLRLLFYGLGYQIPGTYGIKFKNVKLRVIFERNGNKYTVQRNGNYVELYNDNKFVTSQILTEENDSWFTYIWGIDSIRVLRNILGAIYMDQDKGWTLLNRGKVIGNIRFNIRDLLIGLSKEGAKLNEKLVDLDDKKKVLKKTRQLIELSNSSVEYQNSSVSSLREKDDTKLISKYKNLNLNRKVLNQELKNVKRNITKEKGLEEYLLGLNIMLNIGSKSIVVNKDNLANFDDNLDYLRQRSAILQEDIEQLDIRMSRVKKELDNSTTNLFSNTDVIDKTLNDIAALNINSTILEARQLELEKSISELNSSIEREFIDSNELIEETKKWINIFANELGVLDVVKNKRYIFTRDLKSISGTVYYKVVFSFKMAYIKTIEAHTNLILPIVLDSPSGREVTNRNIHVVIDILNKYFKENQIIIASINKYDLNEVKEIKLNKKIFE